MQNDFILTTPIVFIIFNRPDTTLRVWEKIRQAKPKKLIVIADGPREYKQGERELCAETRKVIESVDWECEVIKNYSETNLGCRERISTGLTWVFNTVEEAIILEDDCLPDPSFFRYCQDLLIRYRNDERIMHIGGQNIQFENNCIGSSYYFSRYVHIWGWASWRRAWKHYDIDMKDWPNYKYQKLIEEVAQDSWYRSYLTEVYDFLYNNGGTTWDYQWAYTVQKLGGLSIIPKCNLISNIGFDERAVHSKKKNIFANMVINSLDFPLVDAKVVERDLRKDLREEKMFRHEWKYKLPYPIFNALRGLRNSVYRMLIKKESMKK